MLVPSGGESPRAWRERRGPVARPAPHWGLLRLALFAGLSLPTRCSSRRALQPWHSVAQGKQCTLFATRCASATLRSPCDLADSGSATHYPDWISIVSHSESLT